MNIYYINYMYYSKNIRFFYIEVIKFTSPTIYLFINRMFIPFLTLSINIHF